MIVMNQGQTTPNRTKPRQSFQLWKWLYVSRAFMMLLWSETA